MLAEDKLLDRNFKRDFSDCEPYVDQLYKLFKRRPRFGYVAIYRNGVRICVSVEVRE